MVDVHFIKELVELCITDGEASSLKRNPQLVLVESTTVILVYAFEELPQLSFGMLDEDSELLKLYVPVTRGVYSFENIAQQVISVLERMVDFLQTLLEAIDVYLACVGGVEGLP